MISPTSSAADTRPRAPVSTPGGNAALTGAQTLLSAATGAPRAAILGAGIAGLAAWHELNDRGIQAEIFESTNRVGGRIQTVQDAFGDGNYVNVHAELFDEHMKLVKHLRQRFGIRFFPMKPQPGVNPGTTRIQVNGKDQLFDEAALLQMLFSTALPSLQTLAADQQAWNAGTKPQLVNETVEGYLKAIAAPTELVQYFQSKMVHFWGRDLKELNLTHLLNWFPIDLQAQTISFMDPDEECLRMAGGTEQITSILASQIPAKHIHLNEQVTGIETKTKDGPVSVQLAGHASPEVFDDVISTLPLTALRQVNYSIAGMKPEVKHAIDNAQYGNIANLFLVFDGKPWEQAQHFGAFSDPDGFTTWPVATGPNRGILRVYFGGDRAVEVAQLHQSGTTAEKQALVDEVVGKLEALWPGSKASFDAAGGKFRIDPALNAYSGADGAGDVFVGRKYFHPVGGFVMAGEYNNINGYEGYATAGLQSGLNGARYIARRHTP